MKLNLLPTHVSKASSARTSMIIGILVFFVCALGSVFLYMKAKNDLEESRNGLAELRGQAEMAKTTSDKADVVIANATGILRNTYLAQAMLQHNAAYPNLYDRVKAYIPSFYRVTNMSATPAGPGITTVTMTGNLDTYQQYADLMLALLRMPKVQSVTRAGYVQDAMVVPPLTEQDQVGRPRKPGDPPIPDNWEERLQYFQSNAKTTGYQGVSNFGSGEPGLRGPMPGESQVTVTMTIAEDLQTPDPLATLKSGNTGGAPAPGGQVNRNANPQLSGGER